MQKSPAEGPVATRTPRRTSIDLEVRTKRRLEGRNAV